MTKNRVKLVVVVMVALTIAALFIPGSPLYLPKLRQPAQKYGGQTRNQALENLNSSDPKVRLEAIKAVGQIGPEASEAVPVLTKLMLEDSDRIVRNEAAFALSRMAAPSAVPALAQALEDTEPVVRINACVALSRLRKDARPALPALVKALKDKDNDTNAKTYHFTIQEMAALSIGRATAGTADGIPALLEALASAESLDMHRSLARAFGEIGPEALPAAPELRKLLKSVNLSVREAAEEALKAIGADPKDGKDPA